MSRTKVLLILVIIAVGALVGAYVLGLRTQTITHITECSGYDKPPCSSVLITGNPIGAAFYLAFSLLLVVTLPWLLARAVGRSTSSRLSTISLLLLLLNIVIVIMEADDYAFASYTLFTAPPFYLFLIISTIAYITHKSRVRNSSSVYDRRATPLFLLLWGGLVATYLISPILQ
jgi:hypothetical protein